MNSHRQWRWSGLQRLSSIFIVALLLTRYSAAQTVSNEFKLLGIVSLPATTFAVLGGSSPSEQFIFKEGEATPEIGMISISPATDSATIQAKSKVVVLKMDPSGETVLRPVAAPKPAVHLIDVDIETLLQIYGSLAHRSVLRPKLPSAKFSLNASATNATEVVAVIATALDAHDFSVIPDGEKFVIIVPKGIKASSGSSNIKTNAAVSTKTQSTAAIPVSMIEAGNIDFRHASLAEVLKIYGQLLGRELAESEWNHDFKHLVSFTSETSLTKEEVVYALDTVFAWNGVKMVLEGADKIKAVSISEK